MGDRWYVFQSAPLSEFFAEKQLLRQRFEVLVPYITVEKKRLGTIIAQQKQALFRSYGFVRFDIEHDPWKKICSTFGVRRLFSSSPERPIPIADDIIAQFQQSLFPSLSAPLAESPPMPIEIPTLETNSNVRVLSGSFAGFEGICKYSDDERVVLLMNLLGEVEVTFKRDNVARV